MFLSTVTHLHLSFVSIIFCSTLYLFRLVSLLGSFFLGSFFFLREKKNIHNKTGLIKLVTGVTVGGLVGLLAFRGGNSSKGWRSACAAAGAGIALGSTYERLVANTTTTNTHPHPGTGR